MGISDIINLFGKYLTYIEPDYKQQSQTPVNNTDKNIVYS